MRRGWMAVGLAALAALAVLGIGIGIVHAPTTGGVGGAGVVVPTNSSTSVRTTARPPQTFPRPTTQPLQSSPGIQAAADYAQKNGYTVAVAVQDTATGELWGAGELDRQFAAESVVKVFIATQLLLSGQMSGGTIATAFAMIAESDDDAADELYGLVGGDDLIPTLSSYYRLPALGSGPAEPGWWSNSHINAVGLVEFYAAVKADPLVWPWLSTAMTSAMRYATDGTDQFFGLPAATDDWAIKQGWGADDDDWADSTDFNSTGYVLQARYAVVILLKGPPDTYVVGSPDMVSRIAVMLMPSGVMTP